MVPTMQFTGDIDVRRVTGAVALSVGLHVAVFANLAGPGVFPDEPQRPRLTIDAFLRAVKLAAPEPAPGRGPAAQLPARSVAAAATAPMPRRVIAMPEGTTTAAPSIAQASAPPDAVAAPPVATSAAQERTSPAPERTSGAAAPIDLDVLASQYGKQVADLLVARKRYPRVAQMRGWQGRVELEARFGPGGRLGQVVVTRSSGHETLDTTAVELLQGAEFPPLPAHLAHADFRLRLPVDYRLQN